MRFSEAIQEFGFDCRARKLSDKTISNYQKQLRYLQRYLEAEYRLREVEEVRSLHLKQFLVSMDDKGRKPRYINDLLKVFKTFFNYMKKEGYIRESPAAPVHNMKQPKVKILTFSENEIRKLLNYYQGRSFLNISSGVTKISLPSTLVNVGDFMFYNSTSLSSVTMKEGIPAISKGMFLNCSKLSSIKIPASVITIGEHAFEDCAKLSKVTFAGKKLTEIPMAAFRRCSTLSSITIPEGVTIIGEDAFYGCSKLSSVTIPESVTSIGNYAFDSCSSKITFTVKDGSYAQKWAEKNGFKVKVSKK